MILLAYEDGIPLGRLKKLSCKLGLHKRTMAKVRKYYCEWCKKPRKHPKLKLIDGGNKIGYNKYNR